jgi:hypothetical protein
VAPAGKQLSGDNRYAVRALAATPSQPARASGLCVLFARAGRPEGYFLSTAALRRLPYFDLPGWASVAEVDGERWREVRALWATASARRKRPQVGFNEGRRGAGFTHGPVDLLGTDFPLRRLRG